MFQKRRKNIISRFEKRSPNKFHGLSLVYIHERFAISLMEKYNSVSKQMHKDFSVRKPDGKELPSRHTCRWEDNIKTHLIS